MRRLLTLRRIQNLQVTPGEAVQWLYGAAKGEVKADAEGVLTFPGPKITAQPETLTVRR